jgi:hypothetical protein
MTGTVNTARNRFHGCTLFILLSTSLVLPQVQSAPWSVWTCEGDSTATYQAPTSEAGCCKWTGAWDGSPLIRTGSCPGFAGDLQLRNRAITLISPGAFEEFGATTLDLAGNQIDSVADVTWPSSLMTLDLWGNQIKSVADVTWPPSLRYLELGGNQIKSVADVTWPPSLEYLYLSSNQIQSVTDVTWPSSLRTLSLYNNQIENVTNVTWPSSLELLSLSGNQIENVTDVTWPSSLDYLSLESNQIENVADVTWPSSLRVMYLYGNQIESVADVTWPSSLMYLNLGGNPLGCFQGVPEHVVMLEYLGKKTPRCPSNCTTATFYDASADACLPCGAGTFVMGVGAVMCSRVATASTPVSIKIQELMDPSFSGCPLNSTWKEIISSRQLGSRYVTGGLGKLMTEDEYEVWLCDTMHTCAPQDMMCFTFNERAKVFEPLGLNSNLHFVKIPGNQQERMQSPSPSMFRTSPLHMKTLPDTLKKSPLKFLSAPRRSARAAKPVWKAITEAIVSSSAENHMRNIVHVGASTPPIWTPPWVPGGDLYGRHNLAIVGSSVQDHTMHNLLVGVRTPPIWTSPWVPAGDMKMDIRHNPLMGARMKSV